MTEFTNGTTNGVAEGLPHDGRMESGSVNIPPAEFPAMAFPDSVDAKQVAKDLVKVFNERLSIGEYGAVAGLFSENGYWRDHLALSWDLRTLKGHSKIADFLVTNGGKLQSISLDDSTPCRVPSISQLDAHGKSKCILVFLKVDTDVGTGRGIARMIYENGAWKIIALYTALSELKGFEEPLGPRRPFGASHGGGREMKNWLEQRTSDANFEESEPAVLILGELIHKYRRDAQRSINCGS